MLGGHERQNTAAFAGITMIGLGVEARIAENRVDEDLRQGRVQQRDEAIDIGARPSADKSRYHQVTLAVEGRFELGESTVSDGLPPLCGRMAPTHIIEAPMAAFQTRRVHGDAFEAPTALEESTNGGVEELSCPSRLQQATARLLKSREVRDQC